MKVLHVIPSLAAAHGGPSVALPLMERALAAEGIDVTVATTDDDGPGKHLTVPLAQPVLVGSATRYYFRKQTEFYKASWPLHRWLNRHARDFDLVHIHALFSFSSWSAGRSAYRHQVPYIIRPLGVLNRWGIENRRAALKKLSLRFVEGPLLRHAAAMHYTSGQEQLEAEASGAFAQPFVIPLGIDLEPSRNLPPPAEFFNRFPETNNRPLVLFLSRLDAKKGLDLLLPAFAQVRASVPHAHLVIAGSGTDVFTSQCRAQARQLGLTDAITWTGFLDGRDKLAAFAAARIFVLPSYSENFGIAAVEALVAGLPCVLSEGVAISGEVASAGAGLTVPPNPGPLADALIQLLSNEDQRQKCATQARSLAAERYSLKAMGSHLAGVYQSVLHGPR